MAIRTPVIEPPVIDTELNSRTIYILVCELITPLYGGGVQSATVDLKMPIRAASIRGQLRFWWRLLAKNKWKLGNAEEIRQAEFALWGGMSSSSNDEDGTASKVFVRVKQPVVTDKNLISYQDADLGYVTFPASNETNDQVKHELLNPEGVIFSIIFHFAPELSQEAQKQVFETFRWWANFGGLGFRSRRGMGAFWVKSCDNHPEIAEILTAKDVQEANCQLVTRNAQGSDALGLHRIAVNRLRDFRQGVNEGRNEGRQGNRPGRSRWPEPDAVRRITNSHASDHVPEHPAGNVFPRAVFGMPILYHFVGRGEPNGTNQISPINAERYPSPIILRPIFSGVNKEGEAQWKAGALVLPYQHLLNKKVELDGKGEFSIWEESIIDDIKPISEQQGDDPIQAFLNFFVK